MMSWNKIVTTVFLLFLMACATSGKKVQYRYIFQEELSDIKESIAKGNPSQAVQNLSMLLEMDPKNREARFLRAMAYQKINQYDKAVSDYNTLLRHYPDDVKTHYNLAMVYAFKQIDRKAALKHFDDFLTLDIKNPKAFDVAKIMCSLVINADRSFADWSLKKAMEEQNVVARENLLQDAIALDPTNAEARYQLGQLLMQDGKKDEAEVHLKKASVFKF